MFHAKNHRQLAADYKPLNLGQGFTDYPVPAFIREALQQAATSSNALMNQYTRGYGHLRLVKALAELYSRLTERKIDANSEVLVTVGAYEALYAAIQGENLGYIFVVMFEGKLWE